MKIILSLLLIVTLTNIGSAQTTAIPDTNFEQALIDLGYDTGPIDGQLLTTNINTVTSLNVYNENISDLSGIEDFTALEILFCNKNLLTSLDLSQNSALTTLNCSYNQLTSLDLSPNVWLQSLDCKNNELTTLNVTQNTALTHLHCEDNQLTSLDITQNIALETLNCDENQLTNLTTTQNSALTDMSCIGNQLTMLDLSQNITLFRLNCSNNGLTSLNLMNGNNLILPINDSDLNFRENPYLTCIEVDDPVYSSANWPYVDPASSFSINCSCPTLLISVDSVSNITCLDSGKVFVSASGGVAPLSYSWISSSPSNDSILTTTIHGIHVIQVIDSNNCNLTKGVLVDGQKFNNAFDLNTNLNSDNFRPGILSSVNISAWNDGCILASGQVLISYSGPITFVNSAIPPDVNTANSLAWNFSNWDYSSSQFLSSLEFIVDPSANIGDSVCFDVTITPSTGDADTSNNFKTYCFDVVNSYDPNDKQVYPQGVCPENYVLKSNPLTYTVRFQNTGNASAIDIYLLDTLSNHLDISSLRVISKSHAPLITEVYEFNIVKFRFDNINLADSFSNEPESHGFVTYEIYPNTGLVDGTIIENSAAIYFDFNSPIITNSTMNTLASNVNCGQFPIAVKEISQFYSNLLIYPNPTSSNITIDLGEFQQNIKATLTNNLGQVILSQQFDSADVITIDIDSPSGIYLLQIVSDGEVVTRKIIKK
jgi:hypothetical protein